jgi:type IV pilus assembly protein PilE
MKRCSTGSGFTLIELMITVAIVATLLAVALPSYQQYVQRSNRGQAAATLIQAAQFAERFRSSSTAFSFVGMTLPNGLTQSPPTGAAIYDIAVFGTPGTGFTLRATPVANGPNAADGCGYLQITETGARGVEGPRTVAQCWR